VQPSRCEAAASDPFRGTSRSDAGSVVTLAALVATLGRGTLSQNSGNGLDRKEELGLWSEEFCNMQRPGYANLSTRGAGRMLPRPTFPDQMSPAVSDRGGRTTESSYPVASMRAEEG
jgi:hypothetical protein